MSKRNPKHKFEALSFHTDAERIINYLSNDADTLTERESRGLTPTLVKKLERISLAKSLLFQHKFASKVVQILKKEYGYSEMTAYRDLKLMEQVYGPLLKMSKDMKRAIAEQMIMQDRELALINKDNKALAQCTRNFIQLHQLDKDDVDLPDLSSFEFQPIIFAVIPEQVGENPPDEKDILAKVEDWYQSNAEDATVIKSNPNSKNNDSSLNNSNEG